jgi:hypothetical protein
MVDGHSEGQVPDRIACITTQSRTSKTRLGWFPGGGNAPIAENGASIGTFPRRLRSCDISGGGGVSLPSGAENAPDLPAPQRGGRRPSNSANHGQTPHRLASNVSRPTPLDLTADDWPRYPATNHARPTYGPANSVSRPTPLDRRPRYPTCQRLTPTHGNVRRASFWGLRGIPHLPRMGNIPIEFFETSTGALYRRICQKSDLETVNRVGGNVGRFRVSLV